MKLGIVIGCLLLAGSQIQAGAEPVGVAGRKMDVLLPGPELSVKALKTGVDPLDLRILAVYPHGTAGFRYDLEYIGYVPGKLNLSAWLIPKDGAQAPEVLPPVEVEVTSSLPEGKPGMLEEGKFKVTGVGSGYTIFLTIFVILWLGSGFVLLWAWIKSKRRLVSAETNSGLTPAEQLRPWIEKALQGKLDGAGKAQLERRIIGFWRDRLALEGLPATEALSRVYQNEEAGRLLRLVENWLHNPAAKVSEEEINLALEPYGRTA